MSSNIDIAALSKSWTHSHEEDTGDELIFRPSDQEFPPARGRESLDLAPEGALVTTGPGPDDRRVESTGEWTIEGNDLVLRRPGRDEERFEIVAVEEDRLVVRRRS